MSTRIFQPMVALCCLLAVIKIDATNTKSLIAPLNKTAPTVLKKDQYQATEEVSKANFTETKINSDNSKEGDVVLSSSGKQLFRPGYFVFSDSDATGVAVDKSDSVLEGNKMLLGEAEPKDLKGLGDNIWAVF